MPPSIHSDFGGSVADKWLHCFGYADAVANLPPSPPTIYTVSGSAQHSFNEEVFKTGNDPRNYIGKPWLGEIPAEWKDQVYDEGNALRCRTWIDAIYEHCDPLMFAVASEERLVLSSIDPVMAGTCDLVAVDIPGKQLVIADYKDGSGKIVDVESTPQLPFYAVGADDVTGLGLDASWTVKLMIVQPKAPSPVTSIVVKGNDIVEWRGRFRYAHNRAKTDKTRCAGTWCQWCRASGACSTLAESRRLMIRKDFAGPTPPSRMTSEQRANLLRVAPEVESWLEEVKRYSLEQALAGDVPPGFKLAEGRGGARKWGDESAAAKVLLSVVGEERAYERSLLSPAKAEKVLGKEGYAQVANLVVQSAGKPTLAPIGSERENYSKQKEARAEFST